MIKLLADENIPKKTIELLKQRSIDIISASEASRGLSDRAVIELANTENRVVVTFDRDFGKIVFRERLKLKGLIILRFAPSSPEHIAKRITCMLAQGTPIEERVIVVMEDRVRVSPLNL